MGNGRDRGVTVAMVVGMQVTGHLRVGIDQTRRCIDRTREVPIVLLTTTFAVCESDFRTPVGASTGGVQVRSADGPEMLGAYDPGPAGHARSE